ncbi:hypothetical protein TruAng_006818 [Truncatella angustata]|nr:hypothetical protein TruAng_006818 [Truncatella angustata]
MTAPQYNINAADLPQDPFIPQAEHTTPSFLDTGACVCALRTTPDDSGQDSVTAWQCIGNQTQNVYEATTGKWFNTLHGGSTTSLPIYDASNGPNTATTFQWDAAQDRLVEASGQTGFDIYDRACTAVNQTTFTTAFYRTKDAIARNETLVDAAPCYRGPEAIPIRIQTAEEWEEKGCLEGFLFLLAIDVAILVGIIVHGLRNRFRRTTSAHSASLNNSAKVPLRAMSVKASGYSRLDDETEHDQEMLPMEDTYMPRGDAWHGFHAVLDMDFSRGMRAEELENAQGMTPQLRSFVESMRKATDAAHFGLSFTYSNLSFQPRNSARMILQNVTGSIERGTVTAVMGGSGAGKSTFVNVLMGKTNQTGGSVAINGVPGKLKRYKKLIGYVPQDDIVLPELTVYENILHSARIRLPRTWKDRDVVAHVNSVIDCLELSHVKDSLVGTVGKPVISGGQRKRVSIGMELAAAPMAIFLDEPTSGLDATAASSIMATLKAIARLGISVIVIIHQPRMEIFEMLDNLVLLGNGQLIYEGPEADVRLFFESIGYRFPAHSNYGDVVTDIITGNGRAYKSSGNISRESLIDYWASSHHRSTRNSRAESIISVSSSSMSKVLRTRGASRLKQLWLCLRRAMLQQSRSIVTFWSEMLLASIAGFLIGLAENSKNGVLFTGLYNPPFEILSVAMDIKSTPETSLLVAIAIGLVAAAPGVKVFSEEMLVQRRESEAGHSRLAYFLAKSASVVPRMLLACLHFTTWFMLLSVPIISWNLAFLVNLLYFYCIYGLASFLSMILRREDAPLFATMISLIVGVLCGAAPPLSNVKKWHLEWLWRASPGVWLAEIYFGQMVAPYEYLYNTKLAAANMGFHLDWFQRNLAVLLGIGTLYRLLAYVGLFAGKGIRL